MAGAAEAARPARQSVWFFARISLFWLGLSSIWGALNIQIFPSVVPEMVGEEFQGTAIGLLLFIGLGIAIVVQPLAGGLSDRSRLRWGRRRPFMLLGVLVAIPFLIIIGVARDYWLLLLGVILLQVAANTAHGPYQGIIPDLVRPESRGRASGFFGLANLLGTLVGVGVAAVFLRADMVLPALLVVIVILLATAAGSWLFVREPPPPEPEPFRGIQAELRRRLGELRQRPAFAWLVLSRLFFFMGLQAMDNFLQLFLGDENGLGMDEPELGTFGVLGAVLVVALLTSVPAGWAADRYGRLRLVAVAASLGVLSALLMMVSQSFIQVLIFGVVLGVALGLFTAADWAVAIDLVPDPRAAGLYMGLTNAATAGGDALATLSAGVALDLFNRVQPGLGFRATFALMGIYFLISLLVLGVVRSRLLRADATGQAVPRPAGSA